MVNEEFKRLIIENPTLPIRVFVGEDAWCGELAYNEASITNVSVGKIVLYKGEYMELNDFEETLLEELANDYKSKEDLKNAVQTIIASKNIETAICIKVNN